MKVRRLLRTTPPPLSASDTVETALATLLEEGVAHLAVVDETGALVGLISEEHLLEAPDADAPVRSLLGARPVSVHPSVHVFDATRAMVRHDLSVLPITEPPGASQNLARADERVPGAPEHYLGVVRRHDLFDQFARMLSTQEPGAILALEADERDYSLGQLVHLIEQSDVKVRSISSEPAEGPADDFSGGPEDDSAGAFAGRSQAGDEAAAGPRRITVKLNTTDTARVRHMLEHHGFDIVASFGEQDDQVLKRVQEFMRYLEV